jgi:hypothetical protein
MTIDFSQFVNKEVTVTLNDDTTITGVLTRIQESSFPYRIGSYSWTARGRYSIGKTDFQDIKSIVETTPKQMNNKQQLLKSIQETEAQLNKLKEQLEQKAPTIQEAKVGDTLDDGSIVIKKENGLALLIAPKSTEVQCQWTRQFSEVFDKLNSKGFIPSQWFIPSVEQLKLAYKVIPNEFNKDWCWSSSESSASCACSVFFGDGGQGYCIKNNTNCVRAFRCISY